MFVLRWTEEASAEYGATAQKRARSPSLPSRRTREPIAIRFVAASEGSRSSPCRILDERRRRGRRARPLPTSRPSATVAR